MKNLKFKLQMLKEDFCFFSSWFNLWILFWRSIFLLIILIWTMLHLDFGWKNNNKISVCQVKSFYCDFVFVNLKRFSLLCSAQFCAPVSQSGWWSSTADIISANDFSVCSSQFFLVIFLSLHVVSFMFKLIKLVSFCLKLVFLDL